MRFANYGDKFPPAQVGPRHYCVAFHGRAVLTSLTRSGRWSLFHTRASALERAVKFGGAEAGFSVLDVGSPGPAGLAARFRR
jgi:hypothetical protein